MNIFQKQITYCKPKPMNQLIVIFFTHFYCSSTQLSKYLHISEKNNKTNEKNKNCCPQDSQKKFLFFVFVFYLIVI